MEHARKCTCVSLIFDLTVYFAFRFIYFRTEELKIGTLVGTDKYGNKYYENNEYFYGKHNFFC